MSTCKLLLRQKWRILFTLSIVFVFYTEILCHYINAWKWAPVPCQGRNCTRILLVADPQLLGEKFDEHFYNGLALYDSDNYLKRTFRAALAHSKPDVIVFLGDLFDEGSVATDEQFQRYLSRFESIFRFHPNILKIFLPGDNDLGGENGEIMRPSQMNRFKKVFAPRRYYKHDNNNLIFYQLNRLSNALMPDSTIPAREESSPNSRTIIGLSHLPLLYYHDPLSERALRALKPHIIFSGHLHRSLFIKRTRNDAEFTRAVPLNVGASDRYSVLCFDLAEAAATPSEILVPTCSYRMGEPNIGYGMAVIEADSLRYTVLWCADRFVQLYRYLIFIATWAVVGLLCAASCLHGRCHRRRQQLFGGNAKV